MVRCYRSRPWTKIALGAVCGGEKSACHDLLGRSAGAVMAREARKSGNGKRLATPQSVDAVVKGICDIMRRSNCAGALQYVPELTWILFLGILDEWEARESEESEALGIPFIPTVNAPFRWRDWAAPKSPMRQDKTASVWKFVHERLLPELKTLKDKP